MTQEEIHSLLVTFFLDEYANDAIFVAEWLDNSGYFKTEEERDEFIEQILARR